MTAQSGPWRAIRDRAAGDPWRVWNSETGQFVRTPQRDMLRGWKRRAHAYAHAETLNARDRDKTNEALKELGL